MSDTSTQAPSSANSSLMALPIPLAPPVTTATLSFSRSNESSSCRHARTAGRRRFLGAAKNAVRRLDHATHEFVDIIVSNLSDGTGYSKSCHAFARLAKDRGGHTAHFQFFFF